MPRICKIAISACSVLSASVGIAHANETWTCIQKYENGHQYSSEILIAEDRLMFKGGNGAYTIFENNGDHVLALFVHKDKGDTFTFYLLLERASGRLTQFDDNIQVATKGAWGNVTPTPSNMDCTREK